MRDAILETRDGQTLEVTLDTPSDTLGVVIQPDIVRGWPFVRTFRYKQSNRPQLVPVFEEVDHAFLPERSAYSVLANRLADTVLAEIK